MVEKKLLTLACAVGILACGACFLPPLPEHQPPPPRIELQGIQSIRVAAANVSELHHIDPSALAKAVANSIELRARETGVNATAQGSAGPADAVLAITVLSESAILSLSSNKRLSLLINVSATLTRQDGAVIWRETDAAYQFSYSLRSDDSEDVWQSAFLRTWVTNMLSTRIVNRMFYGR
jgi:hypothetical protein